jgi:hypothetical protein
MDTHSFQPRHYRHHSDSESLLVRIRLESKQLHVTYKILAEIPGVARDSRKSEIIRVICLSPCSE